MKKFLVYAFFISALMIVACTDGSVIGNDLVENEVITLEFEDAFELSGQTVLGDSVATYRINTTNQTYLLGAIDESTFGRYSSDIYTGLAFNTTFPDFENSTLDSVVLSLEFDTLGFYGDPSVVHDIEVYEVTEDIFAQDTIYSDETFAIDTDPIASVSLIPSTSETIDIDARIPDVDSTITLSPRLRIRLDNAYGQRLIDDEDAQTSIEDLNANFKGLYIKSAPQGNSIIGLNFTENPDFNNGIARLHVYYTKTENGEEELEEYSYTLRAATSSTFVHDYTSSTVGSSINNTEAGDQYLFSHNMAGVDAEIFIPDLNFLDNNNTDTIIVNSAQLIVTVNDDDIEFETALYPPSSRFLLSRDNDDGEGRVLVDDIVKDNLDLSTGLGVLDGVARETTLDDGSVGTTVTFNITDYVQNLLKNDISSSKLRISPVGRSESPRRTVFYGVNHPDFPAKLRIAYTKI
ncbi:MAG: DUF4270 family protein [Bacteroidota bacterium]